MCGTPGGMGRVSEGAMEILDILIINIDGVVDCTFRYYCLTLYLNGKMQVSPVCWVTQLLGILWKGILESASLKFVPVPEAANLKLYPEPIKANKVNKKLFILLSLCP